jgi:hypothetical protein
LFDLKRKKGTCYASAFFKNYGRGEIYPPALWQGTCQPQADLNAPEAHKPPKRIALLILIGIKFLDPKKKWGSIWNPITV